MADSVDCRAQILGPAIWTADGGDVRRAVATSVLALGVATGALGGTAAPAAAATCQADAGGGDSDRFDFTGASFGSGTFGGWQVTFNGGSLVYASTAIDKPKFKKGVLKFKDAAGITRNGSPIKGSVQIT